MYNGAVSHGAKIGSSQVLAEQRTLTNRVALHTSRALYVAYTLRALDLQCRARASVYFTRPNFLSMANQIWREVRFLPIDLILCMWLILLDLVIYWWYKANESQCWVSRPLPALCRHLKVEILKKFIILEKKPMKYIFCCCFGKVSVFFHSQRNQQQSPTSARILRCSFARQTLGQKRRSRIKHAIACIWVRLENNE